ncbi:hypothetical protein FRC09_006027 [Ceratobasidium sp. 395]|nr:hypothetical protein FRC09_006027 [Ceratobasidium sp. 395]
MSDLILELSQSVASVSELLIQAAEADYGSDGELGQLRNEALKLDEVNPKKRASNGSSNGATKRNKPQVPKFWEDAFMDRLTELTSEDPPNPSVSSPNWEWRSRQQRKLHILMASENVVMDNALQGFEAGDVNTLGDQALTAIYDVCAPQRKGTGTNLRQATNIDGKGPFQERSILNIYQNIFCSVSAIQYSVRWKELRSDQHPNKATRPLLEAIFRKQQKLGSNAEVDRKSGVYKSFVGKHRNYVRVVNRLARAYNQLSFGYFNNADTGRRLSTLLRGLESRDLGLDEERERGHVALVGMIARASGSVALRKAITQLEQTMKGFVPDESDGE